MKPSTWLPLPLLTISACALVISTSTDVSHDVATIAGSIVETNITHLSNLNSTKSDLEIEYEALELLKQQLFHLHHEVIKKERDILHIINQDFRSCSGVKCYLQTALRKVPDFLELFKTHFRHHSKNSTSSYGCLWSTNSSRSLEGPESLTPLEGPFDLNAGEPNGPFDFNEVHEDNPFDFDVGSDQDSPFDFVADEEAQPVDDTKTPLDLDPDHHRKPDHPFGFGNDEADHPHFRPGPGHHPDHHDAFPPHHNPYDPNKPNHAPPAFRPQDHQPHNKPHHERPPFRMPHPAPRPRHFKLILATAGLVVSFLILLILAKALRIYCANPRVRAERAARIEECRTKREYRRAACQHRLRQCLSRFRRRPRADSTDDYEEKRETLRAGNMNTQSSDVEDHIMGANIASLRRAHELVGHLMRAEEGRSFSFAAMRSQEQPETNIPSLTQHHNNLPSSSRSLHSIHTTTPLPPYAPPPPRYSQELARDIHVVDGFRYTPTQSDATITSSASSFILDDDYTESSVVDCRSRLSMETDAEMDIGRGRSRGRSRSHGKMSLELAGDRYRGRFD